MEFLISKLEQFRPLSVAQKEALRSSVQQTKTFDRGEDIIREGDEPEFVHLLVDGLAGRYKVVPDGGRHIMAYLIPGDLCDIHVTLLRKMDHSIGALSPCTVSFIPVATLQKVMDDDLLLERALWWATLVDEAVLREWLVGMGARSPDKRIAHLFCEMLLRYKAVGLTSDHSFELPLTQEELADTMGLSTVHMNRTLQDIRAKGLIERTGRRIVIHNLPALMRFADFDPQYLHQEGEAAVSELEDPLLNAAASGRRS